MGGGFELEVAPLLVLVEIACQRALDIARACVVALDQVAVIGVHDAHEIGEIGSRARMQALAERGGCGG